MNTKMMIELFGYLGSALVVVSMLMTSVIKLRVINLTGSIIFAIYALIIRSYPTALMNFFLVGINVYHLLRLTRSSRQYDIAQVGVDDGYLGWLLGHYKEDINSFFPEKEWSLQECNKAFIVSCDDTPAGITIGRVDEAGRMDLAMDYSTPVYRDTTVGQYLYEQLPKYGVKELCYSGKKAEHISYVEKMGFRKEADGIYHKSL